jgi:4-hydroxythreonine-4-phosphate dehydrogenase
MRTTYFNAWRRHEPDLYGIGTIPGFAIGQRALLVRTPHGNVLWDCITLIDDATVDLVHALGGITAIAISHPHYYSCMVEWAHAFDVPVWLHAADRGEVKRPDPKLRFWTGATTTLLGDLTLINAPGHFDGAAMLHWPAGAEGRGALLSGDIVQVSADRKTAGFMRSYPNWIPLGPTGVQRIADAVGPHDSGGRQGGGGPLGGADAALARGLSAPSPAARGCSTERGMARVAITMGDPAGIGPEIILKAAGRLRERLGRDLSLVIVGCGRTYRATAELLGIADRSTHGPADDPAPLTFVEAGPARAPIAPGQTSAEAGRLAYAAIDIAVKLAMRGAVDAICTGPLSKEALNLAGHHFAGHTELLAHLTGARDSVMLLAHGNMRVSHVSTHSALADVPKKLTPARLRRVVELTAAALRGLGIAAPRIAVAALNPHAGEGGLFGREDIDVSAPTIAALRAEGHDISGPVPGDTVFVKLRAGQYDAVVAMYHDQGHIPVKLLGFSVDPATGRWEALSGVNVTLGLPIVRTSVDHGTAFDIAGQGIASETSLLEAIDLAVRLAPHRHASR